MLEVVLSNLLLALASAFGILLADLWDRLTIRQGWRGWHIDD